MRLYKTWQVSLHPELLAHRDRRHGARTDRQDSLMCSLGRVLEYSHRGRGLVWYSVQ